MKRIYLLEGPDGCGKSVLATDLAQRLRPAALFRHGPYPGDKDVWARYLMSMLPAYADLADCVLDRSWLSEPIYGAAYRNGLNRISVAQRRMLERVALGRGAAVVLCRTDWKTCAENFRRRKAEGGELLDDTKQLKVVYDTYKQLQHAVSYQAGPRRGGFFTDHVAQFDYQRHGDADEVLEWLDEDALENLGPGIGRWAPGEVALLVGERPGGFGGRGHLPFVSLRADGCSAWLAEQLEAGGVPEAALYWVNAYDGAQPLCSQLGELFIEKLQPRATFALGAVAHEWCNMYSVEHESVDHPQAWRRFHSKKPYPLIKELRSCLSIK